MSGIVKVCEKELRFFQIDEEIFQDKFDLLFATVRLMGYKIEDYESRNLSNLDVTSYKVFFEKKEEKRSVVMVFHLLSGAVTWVQVTIGDEVNDYEVDSMDRLLEKLDEILVYI